MRVARNRHRFRRRIELCAKLIKYCLEPVHRIKIKLCFSEVESRTQGSRPRPRTQKDFEAKAKTDPLEAKAKNTDASVLLKKKRSSKIFFRRFKKKVFKIFFQVKNVSKNFFQAICILGETKKRSLQIFRKVSGVFQRNFNGSKIVLSLSEDRAIFEDLRLRGQSQELQNVSLRTPPLVFSL